MKAGDFQALAPEQTGLRGSARRGTTVAMNEDRQIEVVTGEGRTLRMGLLTNTQDEPFRGTQIGWLVNLARERTGSQASWLGNLALKEVDGWQSTIWGVNWAVGPLQGGQAGPINIASQVRGWQVAAEVNVAGRIRGGQFASGNVAGEIAGVQIGLLNVASRVQGWQVGMINIAGSGPSPTSTCGRPRRTCGRPRRMSARFHRPPTTACCESGSRRGWPLRRRPLSSAVRRCSPGSR